MVEIWHANAKGEYVNTSPDYLYRESFKTDKSDNYNLKTFLPPPCKFDDVRYRPAHVHFHISSDKKQDLITQIYFQGDQYNEVDPSASAPDSIHRILPLSKNSKNENEVIFDVALRDSYLLEPLAMQKITGLYSVKNNKWKAEFNAEDDLLILKVNGQLMETFVYKGNNEFEGGLGFRTAKFTFSPNGNTKVLLSHLKFSNQKTIQEGTRILKYQP